MHFYYKVYPSCFLVPYSCESVMKNKKMESAFNINSLNIQPRHLYPSRGY
jgi:hypothetical protein